MKWVSQGISWSPGNMTNDNSGIKTTVSLKHQQSLIKDNHSPKFKLYLNIYVGVCVCLVYNRITNLSLTNWSLNLEKTFLLP